MSKTKEELDALKEEVEAVNEKLAELTPEEIAQVNGGHALASPHDINIMVFDTDVYGSGRT